MKRPSRAEQAATRAAKKERNAQIAERIKAGEKRYALALEYGIDSHTVGTIGAKAGLPKGHRFKRQINQRTP